MTKTDIRNHVLNKLQEVFLTLKISELDKEKLLEEKKNKFRRRN